MKFFRLKKEQPYHIEPYEAQEGDLIGADRVGFPKLVVVGVWEDSIGENKRFEFRAVQGMAHGGYYYQIYTKSKLSDAIQAVLTDGGSVYKFDDLKEFASWAIGEETSER